MMSSWCVKCVLQVSLLTVTLLYYIYYLYHSVIVSEVVEQLQRQSHRRHVDVGPLATWEQVRDRRRWRKISCLHLLQCSLRAHRDNDHFLCLQCIRTLRGVMLLLLAMKCLTLLRVNRTMATSAALFTRTLSNIFWPMVNTLFQQDHQLGAS